jgi:hypothetical protein
MAERSSNPAPDPFAPPGETGETPLELGARPAPRAVAATMADDVNSVQPAPRKPITYKRPDSGVPTYILWVLAAIGLGAIVIGGVRFLRGAALAPVPASAAKAAPVKPIEWKSVGGGEETVLITVETQPKTRDARLLLDGAPLASNPVALAKGSRHTLTAIAEGFEAATEEVTADAARSVRLQLRRAAR